MSGKALAGSAAKTKRRAQLQTRGVDDELLLDELTSSIGLPGVPFYVHAPTCTGPLLTLPEDYAFVQVIDEKSARAVLRAYHTHACAGNPETTAGRDCALAHGWTAPQQALALAGHHPCEHSRPCNIAISMTHKDEPVGLLAMSLDKSSRHCSVQAIHVSPQHRGSLQLPRRMWDQTRACVAQVASGKRVRMVRFNLALPCCQSQQGAHFWMHRMGWDGTEHAKEAADQWMKGVKWSVGTYELWYEMPV